MNSQQAFVVGLGILGVALVALLGRGALNRYRKSLLKDSPQVGGPWSLDDLRDMKDSGQLTDQEYQALRQRMIRKTMDATAAVKGKPNPPVGPTDNRHRGDFFPPLL